MTDKSTKKTPAGICIRPTSRALPISLLRTREHVMEPIRPALAKIGLTEQKWRILRILAESGPLEQTAISKDACLLLPSLTRILRSMEAGHLIKRHQDDVDRRRSIVQITANGLALVETHQPISSQNYQTLQQKLGKGKLELLLDLLEEVQEIDL